MATNSMKGLFKGLRYITQIFDEEKEQEMQIGLPTDVKHVAHIGSDGLANDSPSWMGDFKPQEHENGQVLTRGNSKKYIPQEMNQCGAGLKELLPSSTMEKPKHKTRRKSGTVVDGSAASSDEPQKQSRHNRSKHGSTDSSNDKEASVRRRRGGNLAHDTEVSNHLPDGSTPHRKATSRPRKLKGSSGGEGSVKKSSKGSVVRSVDTCNDTI